MTIIKNNGLSPVSGTFVGLSEGSFFTDSGFMFRISYVGGSGNDVVLTDVASTATTVAITAARFLLDIDCVAAT